MTLFVILYYNSTGDERQVAADKFVILISTTHYVI